MIVKTIATAALAAGLLAVAPSANAEDQRPCVSLREYRSTDLNHGLTRREMEERWDVPGLGVRIDADQWEYRACGYSMDEAVVGIVVENRQSTRVPELNLRPIMVYRARADVITVHGHARSTHGLLG